MAIRTLSILMKDDELSLMWKWYVAKEVICHVDNSDKSLGCARRPRPRSGSLGRLGIMWQSLTHTWLSPLTARLAHKWQLHRCYDKLETCSFITLDIDIEDSLTYTRLHLRVNASFVSHFLSTVWFLTLYHIYVLDLKRWYLAGVAMICIYDWSLGGYRRGDGELYSRDKVWWMVSWHIPLKITAGGQGSHPPNIIKYFCHKMLYYLSVIVGFRYFVIHLKYQLWFSMIEHECSVNAREMYFSSYFHSFCIHDSETSV